MSNAKKRTTLENTLKAGTAQVYILTFVPGVEGPEWWWTSPVQMLQVAYGMPGLHMEISDAGVEFFGLTSKGAVYSVYAPWASIIRIEESVFSFALSEMPELDRDDSGAYLVELPRGAVEGDAAGSMLRLWADLLDSRDVSPVRFVLAKPAKSEYTGLKVIEGGKNEHKPDPVDPGGQVA